jgi:hypothetical protein
VVGALTALGGLIVIPGSIAMLVRLDRAQLPADLGVVVSLPDQFLIALGLGYVVVPLLIVVAVSLAVTWLPGDEEPNPALAGWGARARWAWRRLTGQTGGRRPARPGAVQSLLPVAFGLIAFLGLPVAVFGFWPPDWVWWFLASLATAVVFLVASVIVAHVCRVRRAGRGVTFGLLVLVAALVFVGWTIAFAGVRAEFPQTTVCLKEVGRLDGVLIGRTDENYYVGEPEVRAALVAIEDDQVDSNISTGLRSAGYGVNSVGEEGDITFFRTALVVAELSDVNDGQLQRPLELGLPVLAFYREGESSERRDERVAVISEDDARRPSALADEVARLLAAAPDVLDEDRPQRRIASVPTGEVTGYRLGAIGPCPVAG